MKHTLPQRVLGRTGLLANPMALGCYSMSNAYGARSDAESLQVIRRAVDQGINIIDTADFYGWGHNEELVASALVGRRGEVVLSTKFGYVPAENSTFGVCGDPAYVRKACEASLKRLNTDYLDLYFQHRLDSNVPIEETVGAMAELVREGKVRYLGLCEVSENTLRRACALHPITAVQAEYSLWTRDLEERMLKVYDELGVTLMAFSPLARGMLSGKVRSLDELAPNDVRRKYPRFSLENFPKNVALVDRLGDVAQKNDCSLSQLALAWLFSKNPRMMAICGCDTLDFLQENMGALRLRLDEETVRQIDQMFAPGQISGDRYHASMMKMLDRS
jgi:aryl-alcohol dehydrogenase-like predicted oxidoreductase